MDANIYKHTNMNYSKMTKDHKSPMRSDTMAYNCNNCSIMNDNMANNYTIWANRSTNDKALDNIANSVDYKSYNKYQKSDNLYNTFSVKIYLLNFIGLMI